MTADDDLCAFELDVLRVCAGQAVDGMQWGAAMGQSLETLQARGLVDRCRGVYFATEAGHARLKGAP